MALNRKYSALPDLDTAPDIYETPELTDDTSTVPTTTGQSVSDNDFDSDDDEDATGISRTRLRVDEARSRFLPSNVDASDVDFSDRVTGKRKSYKTSSRRQRVLQDGSRELGDLSDEDDTEGLARKIARLRREIEEARGEYEKQKAAAETGQSEEVAPHESELDSLSQALSEITKLSGGAVATSQAARAVPNHPENGSSTQQTPSQGNSATYTVTYAASYEQSHALAKAADFDRRLVLLEKSIGIGSSALAEIDSTGLPRAIMPTLETLQKQVSTLSEASTASLDSISRRVRTLTQETETLEKTKKSAKAAHDALASSGGVTTAEAGTTGDSDQTAKINALYGMLPTIESLGPLLPPLLDRLRSLRAIHADAATASDFLDRIEKQQSEMAVDIKQWTEGLDKIEAAIKAGETTMGSNVKVMEGWVKDLEQRMEKMS